jgi:deazaflavin-dependent oxidoreductase (nitroreductase family)
MAENRHECRFVKCGPREERAEEISLMAAKKLAVSIHRPMEEDASTLARGRPWLLWLRGPAGHRLDHLLVHYAGWSPLYLLFGHRTARGLEATPILLRTIGRISGVPRTVVLPAVPRHQSWYVFGTLGGGPRDPLWVGNLRANPEVEIRVRRKSISATARVIEGGERAGLFGWLAERHPSLPMYQRKADTFGRQIPIVKLDPCAGGAGTGTPDSLTGDRS